MLAAPVTIAPVLTPRTVTALASALQETDLDELASALRGLEPFLQRVVEEFFVPLPVPAKKDRFKGRFNKLSRNYEPFRLFLMFRLVEFFQNKNLFALYGRILKDMLGPLLNAAREMDMAPELVAAMVKDYLHLFENVTGEALSAQSRELTFERFSLLVDCVHRGTRFDYGLTAVFLVLEGSIAEPTANNKVDLLTECQKSLFDLARLSIKMLDLPAGDRILDMFESNKLEIAGSGRRLRVVPQPRDQLAKLPSVPRRQSEVDWIRKNTQISQEYRGKWIVVENNELIASDKDYSKARAIAKQRGIKRPFIVFVPSTPSSGFMGI